VALGVFSFAFAKPALAGEPTSESQALLEQAAQLMSQGKLEECVQTLNSVIAKGQDDAPGAALALCRLGECYLLSDRPEQAVAELEKVASQYPAETARPAIGSQGLGGGFFEFAL
jgi:hypothetical protein